MTIKRSSILISSVVAAGAILMQAGGQDIKKTKDDETILFVKAGLYYININKLCYAIDDQGGLVLTLQGGRQLKMTGAEADLLRRWLLDKSFDCSVLTRGGTRQRATDPDAAARSNAPREDGQGGAARGA